MRSWIAGFIAFGLSVAAQAAPGDMFLMQIPNVNGSVTLPGFTGWIPLNSFSAGFTNTIAAGSGGGGAGRLTCNEVMAIKPLDATSPELVQLVATGRHLQTVSLVALSRSDGQGRREFLRLTLKGALITSVLFGGNNAWASRTESLSLDAARIDVTATPLLPDGTPGAPVTTIVDCSQQKI
jgi:type VI secretion system secreted protein Hcp